MNDIQRFNYGREVGRQGSDLSRDAHTPWLVPASRSWGTGPPIPRGGMLTSSLLSRDHCLQFRCYYY